MLIGEFRCRADSEGRFAVPSPWGSDLGAGATVTRGIEPCLLVYPAPEWQRLAQDIGRLPLTSQSARSFARFIFSGAAVCTPDQSRRLYLPDDLRAYGGIEDEVVLVGLFSHAELWCPGRWHETKSSFVDAGTALAEELREFGI